MGGEAIEFSAAGRIPEPGCRIQAGGSDQAPSAERWASKTSCAVAAKGAQLFPAGRIPEDGRCCPLPRSRYSDHWPQNGPLLYLCTVIIQDAQRLARSCVP